MVEGNGLWKAQPHDVEAREGEELPESFAMGQWVCALALAQGGRELNMARSTITQPPIVSDRCATGGFWLACVPSNAISRMNVRNSALRTFGPEGKIQKNSNTSHRPPDTRRHATAPAKNRPNGATGSATGVVRGPGV